MNGAKKPKYRRGAIYVRFVSREETDAVADALDALGARLYEIDRDVDLEHYPQGGVFRPAAVFRLLRREDTPIHELLSAVAELPGVFSVCELTRGGFF